MRSIVRLPEREAALTDDSILSPYGWLAIVAAIAVVTFGAPLLAGVNGFWVFLFTRMLVFALLVLSLDFVFGYAGLLSFGHAAMFGGGAYTAALGLMHVTTNAVAILAMAALAGFSIAAVIGWFSVRAKGIYFAMLTLAFAQMFYVVVFTDLPATLLDLEQVTGGDNGLFGVPTMALPMVDLSARLTFLYFTLALVVLSLIALVRLANSPVGRVLQGIRENEERMEALGYDVRRYKVIGFAISGAFAGLAGGLYVPIQYGADPGLLHWSLSGELIVMLLVGGMGTLWGPMLGAGLIIFLEESLTAFATWEVILGSVFVGIVIFAPNGLAGVILSAIDEPRAVPQNAKRALTTYVEKVRNK